MTTRLIRFLLPRYHFIQHQPYMFNALRGPQYHFAEFKKWIKEFIDLDIALKDYILAIKVGPSSFCMFCNDYSEAFFDNRKYNYACWRCKNLTTKTVFMDEIYHCLRCSKNVRFLKISKDDYLCSFCGIFNKRIYS